jgi:hypothetical protein
MKQTSPEIAALAAEVMNDPNATEREKRLAGSCMAQSSDEISISDAVTVLAKELLVSEDLYFAYQSNIAMPFVDAAHAFKRQYKKQYLSYPELHKIANSAAISFLNLFIKESGKSE